MFWGMHCKETHTITFWRGSQLTENNDNQGEAEEVEEHNQNMAKVDYPNLFENLFD